MKKDQGSAMGLVLIFLVLFGVWLAASLMVTQVALTTLGHWRDDSDLQSLRARTFATVISDLDGGGDCTTLHLPRKFDCEDESNGKCKARGLKKDDEGYNYFSTSDTEFEETISVYEREDSGEVRLIVKYHRKGKCGQPPHIKFERD